MTRRSSASWTYALVALVALVAGGCFYLVFELGRYQAGYSMLDHRRERAGLVAELAEERGISDELRRQLAIAETAGDIDRVTYSQVESSLGAGTSVLGVLPLAG